MKRYGPKDTLIEPLCCRTDRERRVWTWERWVVLNVWERRPKKDARLQWLGKAWEFLLLGYCAGINNRKPIRGQAEGGP